MVSLRRRSPVGVGCADQTLGYRVPAKVRGLDDDVRCRLQCLGVLWAAGHEHFRLSGFEGWVN